MSRSFPSPPGEPVHARLDVGMEIDAGTAVAFMGPSGSGKSAGGTGLALTALACLPALSVARLPVGVASAEA